MFKIQALLVYYLTPKRLDDLSLSTKYFQESQNFQTFYIIKV